MPKTNVVVLDNGAGTIKAGIVPNDSTEEQSVKLVPNAIVRSKGDKATYFGHQIANCKDYSSLHYRLPFEKGFIVDWDAQKAIWDGIFSQEVLGVDSTESSLILTEPYFNLPNIQEIYDQFVFEEYEFSSYHRCTPASLIPHGKLLGSPPPECMLVVDSGFSFTHVIPLINGNIVWSSIRRLDVGGKLLTNHLKELVSFRQWNMMEETYIMNHVKETCCYVSTDFKKDLESTRPIVQKYILPDMSTSRKGRLLRPRETIMDSEQVLLMKNERFSVPEIIFRLNQSGLPSAIAESIASLLEDIQPMFWENISLIGGNTKFPGFRERLFAELRFLAPMDCEVGIYESDDPVTEAYSSAKEFATKPEFHGHCLTRAEYLECGSSGARRKFRDWKTKIPSKETTMKDDGPQVQNASQRPRVRPRGVLLEGRGR
ncbi:actin-related protein Arp6 [Lentinula raphanica]|nr:actin-like protein ARP6 [Lentinula raphanica]KAJ3771626.1 actin-related protein Arp6 [Lentinula raphanica]KAJ3973432.1 actin-related protein Arp6 [Lentinula raphanica]